MAAAPTSVSLTQHLALPSDTEPASPGLTYSGPAINTGASKGPEWQLALRDFVAVGKTGLHYVANPFGRSQTECANVWSARFVGTSTQGGASLWLPQGTGVIVENKYKFTIYEGEFESGFRHGYGKASIFVRSGLFVGTYRGQWERGHRQGFGELVDSSNGTTYSGEWRYDLKHGRGEEIYADGSRYVGLWASGQRHGPGRLHLADGEIEIRDYDHGAAIPMANGGKLAKPAKGVEAYLEECKKKLEAAMSEQDSALPATSASLSGLSGKAGLLDRKNLRKFTEDDLPVFKQQIASIVAGPVDIAVEADTFLAGPASKVSVNMLIDGKSQFLLAPLLAAVKNSCFDEEAKQTFRTKVNKIVLRCDPAVREVSHKLADKVWTVSGNFEDPSEVLLPNKVSKWLESNI